MSAWQSKSLQNLEQKMGDIDKGSLRYHILESAKSFKTSWVELGRALYSVWKDKQYKEWGYQQFDAYTAKEVGIRKQTALKLLRSYYFLEKEEPDYLKQDYVESTDAATVPSYEAIDVLRLAKNKKDLDPSDYNNLKKNVFSKGKDAREVKKDLTALIRQREELAPEEAWAKRKESNIKRLLSLLKSMKEEMSSTKMLSPALLKEVSSLIDKLEVEIK
ncbi:MAG TPA: hypothetical protein PL155_06560 [Candidatus Omnitrophota bacterium]|nr:hypothetical protein [Candidatus Omnitrophota bacterium]HPD83859.1 hypothetical protein [Candidatus Omnitrophota bacterium]HRZ02716.1 hypothetical protein [Candidatus Omnitrophota bacterium]